jgi:transposase-like protein
MGVDDAELLDEVLDETVDYSPDLKALVLRMVHQQQGNVETVATQTGLPLSTLYQWLSRWNQQQKDLKKKR